MPELHLDAGPTPQGLPSCVVAFELMCIWGHSYGASAWPVTMLREACELGVCTASICFAAGLADIQAVLPRL